MPSSSDTAVNTPFMFFGNLKNYCVGLKRDLQLKISDIPLILNDESIVVMTYRHALGAALPAGFVVIKTANVDS
jgi:HK97 family phage major capsid protein